MRTPSRTISAALLALFVVSTVAGQRSSPQFSFPPPNTLASQFGADVFANSQDLSSQQQSGPTTLVQITGNNQQQDQQGSSSNSGSQSGQQQLVAQSAVQPQQSSGRQPEAAQQPNIQLSRPSLSLTSLSSPQQSSSSSSSSSSQLQSSSQRQSQASQAASSVVASSAGQSTHQSSRHHAQSASRPSSNQHHQTPVASAQHHHQHHSAAQPQSSHSNGSPHPSNLQTQQTSQSINAGSNQAVIDNARKAEATQASLAASSGQNYRCPDSFGFFRHHKSCDKYYACENGTATLKLCGNGLMFDDSDPKRENCAYPFSVDCGADRTDLEPPISTPHCPRLYGLFADNANCRVFYSCWNGEASKYECPPGLAYDNEQRVCVWADLVERCDQSEVSDGFVCPDPTEVDQPGHYTRHAHPTDCRKFYVCIEGVARPYGCSFGTVFNVDSLQCDEPENVGGCEKYYGDMDPKLAKKLAREGSSQSAGSQVAATGSSRPASTASQSQSQ